MTWLFFAFPAFWLIFALAFPGIKTRSTAEKTSYLWRYPSESRNGNNPASQRVHEGGGFRAMQVLLSVPLQIVAGAVGMEGGEEALIEEALIAVGLAQLFIPAAVFFATRRFVDLAEHGAEIMHADSNPLHTDAKRWMIKRRFDSYREAEAWRMTQDGQEYEHMSRYKFLAAVDRKRWLSHIILKLGSW